MCQKQLSFLVTCTALAAAIRVDFNTNKGPIIPPTPRTTKPPSFPFPYHEPAPVWEDLSNDIPNPDRYKYVLPPPSRPRPTTNNYLMSGKPPVMQSQKGFYFGKIITANDVNSYFSNDNTYVVPSLSPKYIPNIGFKYSAVVQTKHGKNYQKKGLSSDSSLYYSTKLDKLHGKYNPKTKKYKAYQKIKYMPKVYYSNALTFPIFHYETPDNQKYQSQLLWQQMPTLHGPRPFRPVTSKTITQSEHYMNEIFSTTMATRTATTTPTFTANPMKKPFYDLDFDNSNLNSISSSFGEKKLTKS